MTNEQRIKELQAILAQPYRIEWSYPTSPNAKRFGFYREGCWTVQKKDGTLKGFRNREEAESYLTEVSCTS